MYRIRLSDGRELEFPSVQEFSAAVQDGTVDGDATIFHRRAERWLPVREHPHFIQARTSAPASQPTAERPAPHQEQPGGDVDLDAILSLLDTPGGAPPRRGPSSPPAAPPRESEPVLHSVDDLQFLRTGFERQEEKAPESEPGPAVSSEVTEGSADEMEAVPEEPLPVEALAPDDEPVAPALPEPPPAQPAMQDAPRDGFRNRSPEAAAPPKLEFDPVGGDFGTAKSQEPEARDERRSRWARPKRHERFAPPPEAAAVVAVAPLAPMEIPSPELVAASTPAMPEAEPTVPDLDWASKVEVGSFAVGPATRRKWMPVAAAAGAVLLIVAVILFRKSGEERVEREGLPAAVGAASATNPPAGRAEDTSALVTPPAVPVGGPSATPDVQLQPSEPESEPEVMPAAPRAAPRVKFDPGTVQIAPVNLGSGGMRSHSDLMRFYDQQYGQAQAALEAELVRAGFSRLFGISTLTTSDGLASGRRALTSGRAAMGSYRSRQGAIERAYQDSLRAIGRRLSLSTEELRAWAPRPSRHEPEATTTLAEPILDRADEVLELLQREIGRYRLQGNTLVFENRGSAERYAALRASLERGVAGLDQSHLTLRAVARAIGASLPLEVVN